MHKKKEFNAWMLDIQFLPKNARSKTSWETFTAPNELEAFDKARLFLRKQKIFIKGKIQRCWIVDGVVSHIIWCPTQRELTLDEQKSLLIA